ncbi:hypothetical protein H0H93_005161, partial [Arthromyces matolae]
GYSRSELLEFRPTIYKNLVDSAQAVVSYMRKLGLDCAVMKNRALADKILEYDLRADLDGGKRLVGLNGSSEEGEDSDERALKGDGEMDSDVARAIWEVWKDPVIPQVMDEHSSEFYLMDSAS